MIIIDLMGIMPTKSLNSKEEKYIKHKMLCL